MLCALCSITPKTGITKGRGQNIVRGQNKLFCPVSLQKGTKTKGSDFLPWPLGFTA